MKTFYILNLIICLLSCVSCKARTPKIDAEPVELSVIAESDSAVITGDARTELYYPLLQGKRGAVFGNHTALLPDGEHLVDKLLYYHVSFNDCLCRVWQAGCHSRSSQPQWPSSGWAYLRYEVQEWSRLVAHPCATWHDTG